MVIIVWWAPYIEPTLDPLQNPLFEDPFEGTLPTLARKPCVTPEPKWAAPDSSGTHQNEEPKPKTRKP